MFGAGMPSSGKCFIPRMSHTPVISADIPSANGAAYSKPSTPHSEEKIRIAGINSSICLDSINKILSCRRRWFYFLPFLARQFMSLDHTESRQTNNARVVRFCIGGKPYTRHRLHKRRWWACMGEKFLCLFFEVEFAFHP